MRLIIRWTLALAIVAAVSAPSHAGGGKGRGNGNANSGNGRQGFPRGQNFLRGYGGYGTLPYFLYAYDPGDIGWDDGQGEVAVPATYETEVAPVMPAVVRIRTDPEAKVWFDGVATTQGGELRTFSTPALEAGKTFSYKVRACWLQQGRPVLRSQTVEVTPGTTTVVDLR